MVLFFSFLLCNRELEVAGKSGSPTLVFGENFNYDLTAHAARKAAFMLWSPKLSVQLDLRPSERPASWISLVGFAAAVQ